MRCWPGSSVRVEALAKVSRQQLRSSFTHVALICDDASLQPLLPQLLVCGSSTLSRADQAFLEARLPANVFVVRQMKGWMSQDLMVWLMKRLGECLKSKLGHRRLVISLDCAKIHLHARVVRAMARAGAWCTVVPAKMTWLLQPCDTHLFAGYKRHLHKGLQHAPEPVAGASEGESLTCRVVLQVCRTIEGVMEKRSWAHAFDSCGCSASQDRVSRRVLKELKWDSVPPIPAERPSLEVVQRVYPRRYKVPYDALWSSVISRAAVSGSPPAPLPEELSDDGVEVANVWHGRTRSSSQLHLPVSAEAAGSQESAPAPALLHQSLSPGTASSSSDRWTTMPPAAKASPAPAVHLPRGLRLPGPPHLKARTPAPRTRSPPC